MRKLYVCLTSSLPASGGGMSALTLAVLALALLAALPPRPNSKLSGPLTPPPPAGVRTISTERRTRGRCPPHATWCCSDIRTADPAAGRFRTPPFRLVPPPPAHGDRPQARLHVPRQVLLARPAARAPNAHRPAAPRSGTAHRHSRHPLSKATRTASTRAAWTWPASCSLAAGQSRGRIKVIGHVNGADGRRSRAFYRPASFRRAEVLTDWLVRQGIEATP